MESLLSVLAVGRRVRVLALFVACLALTLVLAGLLALPGAPPARAVAQAGEGGAVGSEWTLPDGRLPGLLAAGQITTPTTWYLADSPVLVTETVSIVGAGSLTIEPGVEVRFVADTGMLVDAGPLVACGTDEDSIAFTSHDATPGRGDWAGLSFATGAEPSAICYALIEYATTGLNLADTDNHQILTSTLRHNGDGGDLTSGGGILWVGDQGQIAANELYDNELGMRFQKAQSNEIVANHIHDNDAFGIGFFAVGALGGTFNTLADNDIHDNGGFGLGFVGQSPSVQGGNFNQVTGNRIYENVAAGAYPGDGIYLLYGSDNAIEANEIYQNAGNGIQAMSQADLVLIGNLVHHNGADGLAYGATNMAPDALHSNVLCSNDEFDVDNDWTGPLIAEGNWFGTNAPALGAEISGAVDWTPWISMAVAAEPDVLHADGASTAVFTLTLRGGGFAPPSPYPVTVVPSLGTFVDPDLALAAGRANTTFVADTTPGTVDVTATDLCGSLLFTDVLTLQEYLDLAVVKSGSGPYSGPDESLVVSYTIVISNMGSLTSTAAVITDVLPVGTSYVGDDWVCAAGACAYSLPPLAPAESVQVTLPLQLDAGTIACPAVLTNVVSVVDGLIADADPTDNVFTLTTDLPCLPDLMIVKNDNVTLPDELPAGAFSGTARLPDAQPVVPCAYVGHVINYLIAYTNWGIADATNVVLTETLPAHTSYVGGGWTHAGGNVYTYSVGTLSPGDGGGIYFSVRVDTIPPTEVVENIVRIGGDEEDLDPSDNVSREETAICPGVLLEVSKDDGLPCAFPGDEVIYTIVLTNPSGELVTGLVVTDTVPAHTTYLESPGWAPAGGDQYTYDVGTLGPYASVSIAFAVIVDDPLPGTVTSTTNVACAIYDEGPEGGVCATDLTELPLVADLRVVKHDHIGLPPQEAQATLDRLYRALYGRPYVASPTAQHEPVLPGDVFSYTITYLNLGRQVATGVVLTETLPAYVSYVGYGWTEVSRGTFVNDDIPDLPPGTGGQKTFYVRVEAVPCDVDYLYNWVHIGGTGLDECNLSNNWSGEETWVECAPFHHLYLPLILKGHLNAPPTPTPSPTPPTPPTPPPTPLPPFVSAVAVDPDTGLVYVGSPELDKVLVVDPVSEAVIDRPDVGDHPVGLAVVTTTQKIYVANLNSWSVTALSLDDRERLADIYVGAQACRVAADPADARVYAVNHLEAVNGVAAIESHTDERLFWYERFHATQGRYGIDVDAAADKFFVAARDAGLIAIQDANAPQADPQIFKLDPPRVPFVVAFNPTTQHLFVTAPYDNKVVVLAPYSIEWARAARMWYQGQEVALVDRTNAGWIKELGVGLGAEEGIAVNPLTGLVYVTNAGSDTVSVLQDAATAAGIKWLRDIAVGDVPQGVAVDVTRNLIYVGNAGSRDLTVIEFDGTTHTVIATIPLD